MKVNVPFTHTSDEKRSSVLPTLKIFSKVLFSETRSQHVEDI